MGGRPPGELDAAGCTMPSLLPSVEASPKQGAFPPMAFCCAILLGTIPPSDSRCAPDAFAIGLYAWSLLDGRHRRVSPVPQRTVHTCRSLYPGEPRCAIGGVRIEPGLRRDMLGSALALSLCRGGRIHLMLRPTCSLPPQRLLTPRLTARLSTRQPGPATGRTDAYPDRTCTG